MPPAVFFCYALPAPAVQDRDRQSEDAQTWTEEAGFTRWYLFDLASEKITDEPARSSTSSAAGPRRRGDAPSSEKRSPKSAARSTNTSNTYLKQVQAPIGVKPILKAWMELS